MPDAKDQWLKPGRNENLVRLFASGERPGPCSICGTRGLGLCGSLTEMEMSRLVSIASYHTFESGQTLIWEEEAAEFISVLLEGCVVVYKLMQDGRRQVTGFLFPTDMIGLAADDRYAYTAQAINHVRIFQFPRSNLMALFSEMPDLARKVVCVASNELAASQDQMLLLGRKTAREKLVTFIEMLMRRNRMRGRNSLNVDLPMPRPDIADYLGLTVETVSRTFTALRKDGLLDLEGPNHLIVRNERALAEIAGIQEHETVPHAASF